jgi:hypothetical protein
LSPGLAPAQQLQTLYQQADTIHGEQQKAKKTLDGLNNIVAMLPALDRAPVLAEMAEAEANETKLAEQLALVVADIRTLGGSPPQFAAEAQPSYNPIIAAAEASEPLDSSPSLYSNNVNNQLQQQLQQQQHSASSFGGGGGGQDSLSDVISEHDDKPWFQLQTSAQEAEVTTNRCSFDIQWFVDAKIVIVALLSAIVDRSAKRNVYCSQLASNVGIFSQCSHRHEQRKNETKRNGEEKNLDSCVFMLSRL